MGKRQNLLFLNLFLFLLISTVLMYTNESKATPTSEAKATDEQKGYVGSASCKGCHESQYESYARSRHAKNDVKGAEYNEACETCHGPGAKHIEKGGGRGADIFAFNKKVNPQARSAKCLSCHEESKELSAWNMSRHKTEDVACNDCHSAHAHKEKNLKADQTALCFECHKDIRAQANRQSHHPIKEGKVSCSSCHNPHGEFGSKMVKADSVNELCYKCHAEKRGPFMFEHPPVAENCLSCHTAHGSNHSKLLNARMPMLCQSCHQASGHQTTPRTSWDTFQGAVPASRMFSRSCLNCHATIHGSNGPGIQGQRFAR